MPLYDHNHAPIAIIASYIATYWPPHGHAPPNQTGIYVLYVYVNLWMQVREDDIHTTALIVLHNGAHSL